MFKDTFVICLLTRSLDATEVVDVTKGHVVVNKNVKRVLQLQEPFSNLSQLFRHNYLEDSDSLEN